MQPAQAAQTVGVGVRDGVGGRAIAVWVACSCANTVARIEAVYAFTVRKAKTTRAMGNSTAAGIGIQGGLLIRASLYNISSSQRHGEDGHATLGTSMPLWTSGGR